MKRLLSLLTVYLFALTVMAQNLSVTSFEPLPNDLTANLQETMVLDQNGEKCALIRIQTTHKGFTYDVGSLGISKVDENKTGEIWLYVPAGVRRIDIRHQQLGSLLGYAFPVSIQGARTYRMDLAAASVTTIVHQDDGQTYFSLTVKPANAMVLVDDVLKTLDADGSLMLRMPRGQHTYNIQASGYSPEKATFTLGKEKLHKTVELQSVMAQLSLSCSTQGVSLYVNEEMKGTGSWTGQLEAGNYRIEARKAGHHSQTQTVALAEREQKTVTLPALIARTGQLDVSYKPVNSEVYIDGQRIGTSPDVFREVLIGEHKVEIKKAGYATDIKTVTIEEGQTAGVTGELKQTVAPSAATASASGSVVAATVTGTSNASVVPFTVNGVTFNMVAVEGGTFTMGSKDSEAEKDEKQTHSVTLSSYYIGQTEVTQELWKSVMGSNPSSFSGTNLPVEKVSWNDCQTFVNKLSALTGKKFRLPTEAEWEYAAKGGNKSKGYKYSGSNDIGSVAWYGSNSGGKTHPVATKQPNELGIYDMSGNIWEWCQDWYKKYERSAQTNPQGPSSGSYRVNRGGSWYIYARLCRSSLRSCNGPTFAYDYLGLRVVLSE